MDPNHSFYEVAPFRGLRFNVQKANAPIEHLVCPPYDVIDIDEQRHLASLSPFNAVNLILPDDASRLQLKEGEFLYAPQKKLFAEMQAKGILSRDEKPSIYVYHQRFPHPLDPKKIMTRRGIIALKRLSDFSEGKMKPHEFTLAGPKADRLNLMKSVYANMSPIFGLYSDAQKRADTWAQAACGKPAYSFSTQDGVEHVLWVVSDAAVVEKICRQLSGTLFIADGHHRYETALNFRKFLQASEKGAAISAASACHYIPIFLANLEDDGLLILPTHRMLHGLKNFDGMALVTALQSEFEVRWLNQHEMHGLEIEKHLDTDTPSFIFQFRDGASGELKTVHLRKKEMQVSANPQEHPLDVLDLTILHRDILEKHLNIDKKALEDHTHLHYTRSAVEAFSLMRQGSIQGVFFTRSPQKKHVVAVCEAGLRMPQKSTYFFPKVLSGLMFRPIDPNEDVTT